jgi:hypothetical protein
MRDALRHPFALAPLIASLIVAAAVRFLPALEPWSPHAPWILLLGLLAYAASVYAIWRWRPSPPVPVPENDLRTQDQDIARLVQDALRKLNNLSALSKCELVLRLPRTLLASRPQLSHHGGPGELTPLGRAQALREVLIAAIELLKPPGESTGAGAPQALQYHILHEAYVQRRRIAYVMTRHSIGEAMYHRNRRAAISALARHLETQEELIANR